MSYLMQYEDEEDCGEEDEELVAELLSGGDGGAKDLGALETSFGGGRRGRCGALLLGNATHVGLVHGVAATTLLPICSR